MEDSKQTPVVRNAKKSEKPENNYDFFVNSAQKKILDRHLKSIDKEYLQAILAIGKVCIYKYEKSWEEMDIEGSLYIYSRKEYPLYRMIIFNKKSLNDFKLNIAERFNLEMSTDKFVIFSHSDDKTIFGFWFEERSAALMFYNTLNNISNSYREK